MSERAMNKRVVQGSMWGAGVLLVVALVAIFNYFGMKYYQRWDWTGEKLYSLSEKTEKVLDGLSKPIEVTLFLQPSSSLYDASKELLERYAARSKEITLREVDPERNLVEAQSLVDKYQIQSLNVVVFDAGDDRRVVEESALADYDYSGMQFGQQPTMKGFKGEEAFTSAVVELVEKKKPKVLWTTGHGEASFDDFGPEGISKLKDLLGKENLEMTEWASLGQPDVPAGTDLVVIAGPRANFVQPELDALDRYLDGGGRMLVMLDPELDGKGGLIQTGLEPWLAGRGVDVGANLVVDPSATLPFYGAETIFVNATGRSPVVESLMQANLPVIFALARSVRVGTAPADYEGSTLLQTTADGWGEVDLANLRGVEKGDADVAGPVPVGVVVAAKDAAKPEPFDEEDLGLDEEAPEEPAADAAVDARPKWRLVVFGDSDFARNGQIANVGNPTLASNAFNWLLERKELLGIGPKKPEQVRLTLTPDQLSAITWGTLAGMPALAIVAGVLVWRRRRR
ncbi:MAG: GldG family protein [Holophagales bacterium]|nr:GldG family protein [Holophagales bacterium]